MHNAGIPRLSLIWRLKFSHLGHWFWASLSSQDFVCQANNEWILSAHNVGLHFDRFKATPMFMWHIMLFSQNFHSHYLYLKM